MALRPSSPSKPISSPSEPIPSPPKSTSSPSKSTSDLAESVGAIGPEGGPSPAGSDSPADPAAGNSTTIRTVGRFGLAALLILAGISHLTFARDSFKAQVPGWIPVDVDAIVLGSGVVEIGLGLALLRIRSKYTGWVVGAFFVAVFPGNIAQFVGHKDAFGLDTDTKRAVRLLFQPLLVAWAVWSTADGGCDDGGPGPATP